MDLDEIKRGLRAEIKKRENEQYATFQCNIRQMCKDVLAKLEEQESEIVELKKTSPAQGLYVIQTRAEKELRHQKYKRCMAMADYAMYHHFRMLYIYGKSLDNDKAVFKINYGLRWRSRWLALAYQFKEAK